MRLNLLIIVHLIPSILLMQNVSTIRMIVMGGLPDRSISYKIKNREFLNCVLSNAAGKSINSIVQHGKGKLSSEFM